MTRIETTFEEIIRWLQSTSQLSPAQANELLSADQAATALPLENRVDRAWYVKIFIGLSAWIAALFLISGTTGLAFVSNGPTKAIVGLLILGAAIALKWKWRESIFVGQFSFATSLTGQVLLFFGIIQILGDNFRNFDSTVIWITAAIILLVEVLLFFVYPDTVHRLFSVLLGSLALVVLITEWSVGFDSLDTVHFFSLIPLLLMLFAVGMFLIWQSQTAFLAGRWHELFSPLGYGFAIVTFCLTLLSLALGGLPDLASTDEFSLWWMASLGLALLLAHLAMQVVDEYSGEFARPLLIKFGLLAAIALLFIPLYNTTGIWTALLALVLGFRQNSRLLLGLASLFLLFFVGSYYYSLEITLLNKSYALMGSGLILLLVRFAAGRLWGRTEHELAAQNVSSSTGELSA